MLPVDHPKRTEAQLDSAVAMLEGGSISSCADSILKPMMEQTEQVGPQSLGHLVYNHTTLHTVPCCAMLCQDASMIQACYQALQGRACLQICIWDLDNHASGSERLKALKAIINIAVLCQVRSAFVNVPSYIP